MLLRVSMRVFSGIVRGDRDIYHGANSSTGVGEHW